VVDDVWDFIVRTLIFCEFLEESVVLLSGASAKLCFVPIIWDFNLNVSLCSKNENNLLHVSTSSMSSGSSRIS